jgi:hypothetical protein
MKLSELVMLIACSSGWGCEKVSATYSYDDVVVRRTESIGRSSFYYMNGDQKVGKFWVRYGGMNDGFRAYLKFVGKKIVLFSGDGHFQSDGLDSSLFEYKRIGVAQEPRGLPNVCYISDFIEMEEKRNSRDSTSVRIKYLNE